MFCNDRYTSIGEQTDAQTSYPNTALIAFARVFRVRSHT